MRDILMYKKIKAYLERLVFDENNFNFSFYID